METARDRLRARGDVLADFFANPQSLTPLLESGRLRRVARSLH
jgi:hypothetical protein